MMQWGAAPEKLTLCDDEVHVWRASLDLPSWRLQPFYPTLADDEHKRASQFHFRKDRERFMVRRGILRAILGRYLKSDPGQLRFCYGPQGKPALSPESATLPLRFNLSHSDGIALFAVTSNRELGIDIEYVSADLAEEAIAEQFFSPREAAVLKALTGWKRREAFFACWTRKEAYIKARGEGLTFPLDRFEVSLVPGEPAALLYTQDDPQEVSRWSLRELYPAPGYKAALAVEGSAWRLCCWQWPEE
jgi:4'-phosphopantetheinyl transferase